MKRLGIPQQIGDAVAFLAPEGALQINGHLLWPWIGTSIRLKCRM